MTLTQAVVATAARHPYAVLLIGIFAENAGLPLPGEILIVVIAATAVAHHASLPLILLASAFGAILGDNFSYWVGRRGGRFLLGCYCRATLSSADCSNRIVGFYRRLGSGAVTLARFVPTVRALMAPVAGMTRMRWAKFVLPVEDDASGRDGESRRTSSVRRDPRRGVRHVAGPVVRAPASA